MRSRAAGIIRQILIHPDIEVVPQSRQSFLGALAFYEARPDKDFSLTDCSSMVIMRALPLHLFGTLRGFQASVGRLGTASLVLPLMCSVVCSVARASSIT